MAARKKSGEGRVLKSNVWVGDPAELFLAGSVPTPEVAELITNPNAWADDEAAGGEPDA